MNTKNIRSIIATGASSLLLLNFVPMVAMADNPVPVTSSISPSSVLVGSSAMTLTVNGANFVPGAVVNFNGSGRSSSYASSNQLTATIPASDLSVASTFSITVTNPGPGGGTSGAQSFTVANLVPSVSSISPSLVASGSSGFTLIVNGASFVPGATVIFNGSARLTAYVSATQLHTTVNSSDVANAGSFNITVSNPGPGGGTSGALVLTVTGNNPTPLISSISPSSKMVGSNGFTMIIYGSNFTPNSWVRYNGITKATTYISPTQLMAAIPASDMALTGTYMVDAINPTPGGGSSNMVAFTVSPTTVTPGLPNTGFGPTNDSQAPVWIAALIAGIGIIGMAVIVRKARYAWMKK